MEKGIGDFLSDEQPSEPTETVAAEPTPEAAPAEPVAEEPTGPIRDEHGRFARKEPTGVEEPAVAQEPVPPTEPVNQLPRDVYEPLKAERQKRQEAEERERLKDARLAELERQFQAMQQPQHQAQPAQTFWDAEDPDGHINALVERRLVQRDVERSIIRAKGKYSDFDQVFAEFDQLEKVNPTLTQQAIASDDPAEFAYQTAKKAREVAQYGSIDALIAAERAKWEAEAKAAFQPPVKPVLPSTTAGDTSVGSRSGPAWGGPTAIGDILR